MCIKAQPRTRPKPFAGFAPSRLSSVAIVVTVSTDGDDWPVATFTSLDALRSWVGTVTAEQLDDLKEKVKAEWSRDGGDTNHAVLATVFCDGKIVKAELLNNHLTSVHDDWFFDR